MKNLWKIIAVPITLGVVVFTLTFAWKKTASGQSFPIETQKYKYILTLWNIDTFEGGIGSRADFLSTVALDGEDNGTLVMVINHTKESAEKAIQNGKIPDMVSFGVGADFVTEYALKLRKISYTGGDNGGNTYAYPWCMGGYFLISKSIDNRPIERLIVSQNDYNLPCGAIYYSIGEASRIDYYKPLEAYTEYLSDRDCFFLGTQRDIWRLIKREVEFECKPLEEFSDAVQYISITTKTEDKIPECEKFIERLLSDGVQEKITKIGMFPINGNNPYTNQLSRYSTKNTVYTVSPFTSSETLKSVISEVNQKNITNNSSLNFKNVVKRL